MSGPEPVADEFEDHPTNEEIERNLKKLFGDNVVPYKASPPNESGSTEDVVIAKLNEYYAKTMLGNQFKIIDESIPGRVRFLDEKHFISNLRGEKALITITEPGGAIKPKFEPVSTIWLNHKKARRYRMVIFDPRREFQRTNEDYNLWPGFAIKPVRGNCYKFLRYVRDIVCAGDKAIYRWLMAWVAHMVQRPWEKPETAVAIQGEEEGTGKSFFPKVLSILLDGLEPRSDHLLYFTTSNSKMITGDFSGHLEYCVLLHAEEAFSAENERENSIIKNLVSEDTIGINAKNKEAKRSRNFIRLILTGNPPHIVKAGRFARRFLVLKILPKQRLNTDYFRELSDDLHTGGFDALMFYLARYPIFKYNLRVAPRTNALSEQQEGSFTSEEEFWHNRLHTGELTIEKTTENHYYKGLGIEALIGRAQMFYWYQHFARKQGKRKISNEVWFGRNFSKFFNENKTLVQTKNKITGAPLIGLATVKPDDLNYYVIPKLSICRELFQAYLGRKVEWPDESEEWIDKPYE